MISRELISNKPIRSIEYSRAIKAPSEHRAKADAIFRQKFNDGKKDWTLFSDFTKNLFRQYLPSCRSIIEPEWFCPIDIDREFRRDPDLSNIIYMLENQMAWVFAACNGDVAGKRVLDLGCGSAGDTDDFEVHGKIFSPWLCRTLLELGAEPIGVDCGELDQEKFESHRIDLLKDSLDFIPDNSIDVVHSQALFTSPELFALDAASSNPKYFEAGDRLMDILKPQIVKVLKPDGTFVFCKHFSI